MTTLHCVSGRARVSDVKLKSTSNGTEVVVGLAFRLDDLDDEERSTLFNYYTNRITVQLAAVPSAIRPPTPMDSALERVNGQVRTEHVTPGPEETCTHCGELIGQDKEAIFGRTLAGPMRPLHGDCIDPHHLAGETQRAEDLNELAALLAELPPDLYTALQGAFEALGEPDRYREASAILDHWPDPPMDATIAIPEDPEARRLYLAWLRNGTDPLTGAAPEGAADDEEEDDEATDDEPLGPEDGAPAEDLETEPETPARVLPGRGRGGRR